MKMSPEKWQKIKPVFYDAIELEPEKREDFARAACGDDGQAFDEIKILLDSVDDASDFIGEPVFSDSRSYIGENIGNFRIVSEIGRGGMGIVFLAERTGGEFEQKVAVKILKRGIDSEEIVRRFSRERQIQASLDHPNIARLIDGGTTNDDLPYFVMEYIEGLPLIKFCETTNIQLNEKIALFLKICSAVSYAHQHLIVHRDLKPSNIVVAGDGTLKLLDFGIAKILGNETGDTHLTQPSNRMLTPEYASPEQVRGDTITTASDVYSLGVILYELLTGRRPYDFKMRSVEETYRLICNEEPVSPDTNTNPRLDPDLRNIVLFALRKEPGRRYASVEQLSEDLRRFEAGLPVMARADTFVYRASKFGQRNKVGVAAAAVIVLTLLGGILATGWQARHAQQEKAKAESVNAFLVGMLKYSNPIYKALQKGGHEATINDVLDEAAKRLNDGEFDSQPGVKADIERTVANAYFGQNRFDSGEGHLRNYVTLTNQIYGEKDPKTVDALALWAGLLFAKANITESENLYRQVLPALRLERINGNIKSEDLATALTNFGYVRRTQGDSKEAESLFREALSLNPQISPDEVNYVNGTTPSVLASTLADQGRFDEALEIARKAVEDSRPSGEAETPTFGFSLTVYSGFLTEKNDFVEADKNLKEAETIFRKNLSSTALWLGDNLRNQAASDYSQGKYAEAIEKADETLKIYAVFGTHYDHYPTALIVKGLSLAKTGNTADGEKLLREAVEIRTSTLPADHYWVALANSSLGECLMIEKKYNDAEPLLVESYESLKSSQGKSNPRTELAMQRLVALYAAEHKPEKAAALTP